LGNTRRGDGLGRERVLDSSDAGVVDEEVDIALLGSHEFREF
jgi:hypothetical protein